MFISIGETGQLQNQSDVKGKMEKLLKDMIYLMMSQEGQLPEDIFNAVLSSQQLRELEAYLQQFNVLDVDFELLETLFKPLFGRNIDE